MESANQKDVTDVISFQFYVDISIKYILNLFSLSEIMVIGSTCLGVKDLDLYIIEIACKLFKTNVILFFKYKDLYLIRQLLFICVKFFLALSM